MERGIDKGVDCIMDFWVAHRWKKLGMGHDGWQFHFD